MPNKSLYDIITLERTALADISWDFTRRLIIIYGIVAAISYLHSHKIIHRDLKPANILIDKFLFPKIGDFGFSKILHSNKGSLTIDSEPGIKGTPSYMSPEAWKENKYTNANDVYSFAIIVYEIITNNVSYQDCSSLQSYQKVINDDRHKIDITVPDLYRDLIEKCWSQNLDEYKCGKMLYRGNGYSKNRKEAMKYFVMPKFNGCNKCDVFLSNQKENHNKDAKKCSN